MHGVGAPDGVGAHLGQADVPHGARLHQVGDRPDRVLDRDGGIQPPRAIDVDVVDPEAGEAVRDEVLHRDGPRVDAEPPPVGPAQRAELHGDPRLVAPVLERPTDQHLVVTGPVVVAGVEQVTPASSAAWIVAMLSFSSAGPYEVRHAHATERERKNRRPFRPQLARFRRCSHRHAGTMDSDRALPRGQADRERGPRIGGALDFDAAAELIDQREDRREAEARPLADGFGREERFEDPRLGRGVHPASGVPHGDDHVWPRGETTHLGARLVQHVLQRANDQVPPSGIASRALAARLSRICSN